MHTEARCVTPIYILFFPGKMARLSGASNSEELSSLVQLYRLMLDNSFLPDARQGQQIIFSFARPSDAGWRSWSAACLTAPRAIPPVTRRPALSVIYAGVSEIVRTSDLVLLFLRFSLWAYIFSIQFTRNRWTRSLEL